MMHKIKKINKKFSVSLFSILAILFSFTSFEIEAQSQTDTKKQIKKIIKARLNDRTSDSWISLRALKKKKLALKDKIASIAKTH